MDTPNVTCKHCGGTGKCRNRDDGGCPRCSGWLPVDWFPVMGSHDIYGNRKASRCEYCYGNGRVSRERDEDFIKNSTDRPPKKGGYV